MRRPFRAARVASVQLIWPGKRPSLFQLRQVDNGRCAFSQEIVCYLYQRRRQWRQKVELWQLLQLSEPISAVISSRNGDGSLQDSFLPDLRHFRASKNNCGKTRWKKRDETHFEWTINIVKHYTAWPEKLFRTTWET